jgi:hypothetical protein
VVSSDLGAVKDLFSSPEIGQAFSFDDVKGMCDLLKEFNLDKTAYLKTTARFRSKITSKFDSKRMAMEYIEALGRQKHD